MVHESSLIDRRCVQLIGMLDGDQIFTSAAKILTDECGVHMSWIANPTDGGVVIRQTSGNRTQCSRGVFLKAGLGLGGKVYATGRLQYVEDYVSSSTITHDYDGVVTPEEIDRMVAAPILFADRNYGVLFGGYRGSGECGERAMNLLESVAERCGEALYFLERLRASTESAVRDERRRTTSAVRDRLNSTLATTIANLRDAEEIVSTDEVLARRIRDIERHAIDSNARLLSSLETLLDAPVSLSVRPTDPVVASKLIAKREYEVLCRVAIGETNAEIGEAMNLSCNTIKTYLRNVMTKLGARNRVEAIVNAKELGLL